METCTGLELTLEPDAAQDVPQLARLLLTVLVEDSLRLRLASAARAAALQYAPSVIADRCGSSFTASGSANGSLYVLVCCSRHPAGWLLGPSLGAPQYHFAHSPACPVHCHAS